MTTNDDTTRIVPAEAAMSCANCGAHKFMIVKESKDDAMCLIACQFCHHASNHVAIPTDLWTELQNVDLTIGNDNLH